MIMSMETTYKISTDKDTINKYLKQAAISYFWSTMLAALVIPLLFVVGMIHLDDSTPIVIMITLFFLINGFMIFSLFRRIDFLTHFLKSEFVFDDYSLTLNIDGQFKRVVCTNREITIKTTSIGTFVLNGEYSFGDFYFSKYSPIGIPLRYPNDIFIPKVTENYDNLIEKLKRAQIGQE
jgi:hypothetical protein